jgi:transcriptional regulator with XRE-family HTH domain
VRTSSISKHRRAGTGTPLAVAIGREILRRRKDRGLTQASLGEPLTRAFVSAVERGHTVPSIAALALLTDRLGARLDEFFAGVNDQMTKVYTPPHEHRHPDPTSRRRR